MGVVLSANGQRQALARATPGSSASALGLGPTNATLLPKVVLRTEDDAPAVRAQTGVGAQRHIWQGRYGTILIEVVSGEIFVNGSRVEPHSS